MPFGIRKAVHVQTGLMRTPRGAVVAVDLLCDGGSRPNPGVSQSIVHDGRDFLPVPTRPAGTNHGAVYDAVDFGLDHARVLGAADVTITLLSRLVWRQVTGNGGCRLLTLRRDRAVAAAGRFRKVTWVLATPPLTVAQGPAPTARALRRLAERSAASASPTAATGAGAGVRAARSAAAASARATGPLTARGGTSTPAPARRGP